MRLWTLFLSKLSLDFLFHPKLNLYQNNLPYPHPGRIKQMSTLSAPLTDSSRDSADYSGGLNKVAPGARTSFSFSSDGEDDDDDSILENEKPPHRSVMLVTMAIFMGYAALVLLQHRLSQAMNLESSEIFQHGCSFNYIGNLIFRLAHNFVFSSLRPRYRVYISLGSMSISMCLLGFIVVLGGNHWVGWSYVCYFLGGVAIGTFESNLLTSITPLGHATKVWAIIGMPSGFAAMSIGGFAYRSLPFVCDSDNALASLYILVAVLCVVAMFVFAFQIPDKQIANNSVTLTEFMKNVKLWREWLPQLKWLALALAINMFSVSFFSGIMFYILNDRSYVPLFGQFDHEKLLVSHGWFFTIFNAFTFMGDFMSRRLVYSFKPRNPLWYLLVSITGAAMCLARFPIIAPLGIYLVFFANGAIYGTSTRFIDTNIPKEYNLIALSCWLFLGDLGSVTGSNIWQSVRVGFCDHSTAHYMCVVASNITSNVTSCG